MILACRGLKIVIKQPAPEVLFTGGTHLPQAGAGRRTANTLTRAVGASERVEADWSEMTSSHHSRFLLCTDGVHDVESAARLAVFAAAGPIESAARRLAADIERRGAPDNYSFVIVEV